MPRPRQRARLEDGLKLDLNQLMRRGCMAPGAFSAFRRIWTNTYTGEETAPVDCIVQMQQHEGEMRIAIDDMVQTVIITPRPRNFGGYQWYFVCPVMNRLVSVLWMPPGATRSCSRQAWGGRRVAYASQFLDADNRAHRGQSKIKSRLIGDHDPDDWSLPPKPKWMRWHTYNRYEQKFDGYEEILDEGCFELMAKLLGKNLF